MAGRTLPGRRTRVVTFLIALVLQSRSAPLLPPGPALVSAASLPRSLPEGRAALAAAVVASLLTLRVPARVAGRSGLLGTALRAGLLALTFDAWAASSRVNAVAEALARSDPEEARRLLAAISDEALPLEMTPQEIADRAEELLAAGAADRTIGPWLAYALFDLPGAVAYHLPALMARIWGEAPGALLRLPLLNRAVGAGPRLSLLRGLSDRATGVAYGLAAPAVGGDPMRAVQASLSGDVPAMAAANSVAAPELDATAGLRRALRLHQAALGVAGLATLGLIIASGGRGRDQD